MTLRQLLDGSQKTRSTLKRRLALEEAYRLRGCPPSFLLFQDPPSEALRRHLKTCPWCCEDRDLLMPFAAQALHAGPGGDEKESKRESAPAEVGDLRRILETFGGWGQRGRYFNPPLVLLVERVRGREDAFRAAQVHDFETLKGPGDIALFSKVFAESWNMLAVGAHHLGPLVRRIDADALAQVRRNASQSPPPVPMVEPTTLAKELHPPKGQKNDYREAFRRLEKDTAAFFANRLLQDLVNKDQRGRLQSALRAHFADGGSLEEAFGSRLVFGGDSEQDSCLHLLLASWMPRALPMAAAGARQGLFVKRIHLSPPPPRVDPVWAELTVFEETDKGFLVGGKISEPVPEDAEIHALWRMPWGRAVAWEATIDPRTGFFRLLFPEVTKRSALLGNLEILVGRP